MSNNVDRNPESAICLKSSYVKSWNRQSSTKQFIAIIASLGYVSAHRTPDLLVEFSKNARRNGYSLIIAAAGGAAHLPGMVASMTTLPVIGVPIKSSVLSGVDSLYSIVQMPAGVPVLTMAIGVAGAKNAAISALSILGINDEKYANKYKEFKQEQERIVLEEMKL